MGTNRVDLYNKALLLCDERFLTQAEIEGTGGGEPRRLLDHVWNTDGVEYCLEQGAWQFAMRTTRIEIDQDFSTPAFGYQNAFTKPDDWVRTDAVCSDEYFNQPITRYADEVGHWFADIDPLYVKFVSKDDTYGKDLSLWQASFTDYVANLFASRIVGKLTGEKSDCKVRILGPAGFPERGSLAISLAKARTAAALTQPTKFPAEGSWTRSRRNRSGGWGPFGDGGRGGSLLG